MKVVILNQTAKKIVKTETEEDRDIIKNKLEIIMIQIVSRSQTFRKSGMETNHFRGSGHTNEV